jgi:hypothetical protein
MVREAEGLVKSWCRVLTTAAKVSKESPDTRRREELADLLMAEVEVRIKRVSTPRPPRNTEIAIQFRP